MIFFLCFATFCLIFSTVFHVVVYTLPMAVFKHLRSVNALVSQSPPLQMASFSCQAAVYCLLCFAAVLAAPPKYVYRADFRPPEKIFSNGFQALGNNANLRSHVGGYSCSYCKGNNSAFVATTSEKDFAIAWGRDRSTLLYSKKNLFMCTQSVPQTTFMMLTNRYLKLFAKLETVIIELMLISININMNG